MIAGVGQVRPRKGQPVLVLAGLILFWISLRAAALSLGEPTRASFDLYDSSPGSVGSAAAWPGTAASPADRRSPLIDPAQPGGAAYDPAPAQVPGIVPFAPAGPPSPGPWQIQTAPLPPTSAMRRLQPFEVSSNARAMSQLVGHQLLYSAAFKAGPGPGEAALLSARRGKPAPHRRWSADAWALWRQGSGSVVPVVAVPGGAYGASQAGTVLRYRLAGADRKGLTAYLRGSAPLDQPRDAEVAAGLSLQPVRAVPFSAFAEVRADQSASRLRLRPAAGVVSAIDPLRLPLGVRAETYLQAGYVGGADATPFVDGQVRVDRRLVELGKLELRAGAGLWGGAQKGASRLDAGPAMTLSFPLGPGQARLSADWRMRVLGKAEPGSGLAVTLAAGF